MPAVLLLAWSLSALADDSASTAAAPAKPPSDAEDEGALDLDRGSGTLSDKAIADVMKKNGYTISDCFGRTATRAQTGRMVLEFEIAEDGSVKGAKKLESTLGNPSLEECVAGAVRRYKFPPPSGGTVVTTWPFVF